MSQRGRAATEIGADVRRLRAEVGWTQRELADRARVSQGWISLVERGHAGGLSIAGAERIIEAIGARLVVTVDAPYLGDRVRQRDPAHVRMSAYVGDRMHSLGWLVSAEVEVGGDRSRGWIDLLAFHPGSGVVLVIELKTEIHDLGRIERSLDWYAREAWAAARRCGWRPRTIASCLLLLLTEASDARAQANRAALDAGFPLRARHLASLPEGLSDVRRGARAVAMVDPRSRRSAWIRPLHIDGRRTAAPYEDYAGFLRAAQRVRRRRVGCAPDARPRTVDGSVPGP